MWKNYGKMWKKRQKRLENMEKYGKNDGKSWDKRGKLSK